MDQNDKLKKLENETLKLKDFAKEITITDDISLGSANEFLVSIKRSRKEINEAFNPIIKKAHEAHKEAIETKKKYEKPLIAAEMIVKPQIAAYFGALARKQREAEIAAEKAEEERRLKEEAQLKTAIEAENKGDFEKRDEIMEDIIPETKPVEYVPAPKLAGTSIRKIWKWKLVSLELVPREYLIVNTNAIMASIRENKGATKISGIQIYSEDSVATRVK